MGWQRFLDMISAELNPATTPAPVMTAIKADSVVAITKDATYYTGGKIPDWVKNKKWIVKSVSGDRAVIDKSAEGLTSIKSPINVKYLQIANSDFKPYLVRVNTSALNIRKGPGTNYAIVGTIRDKGTYTIVEQKGTWGKLKSGAGWISLNYCIRI